MAHITRVIFAPVILTLALLNPITSYAWNAMGHMLVAKIAYTQLKPKARKKVDQMIGYFNEEYTDMKTFLNIAYWPDEIRSQNINTYTRWHYIDTPLMLDGTLLQENTIDSDNAVWAIKNIKETVANDHANPFERVRFLAFLVHIVGDMHQPLHTVTGVSAAHPKGDQGGNTYLVKRGKATMRLHQVWDNGLGSFNGEHSFSSASQLAETIMQSYPREYFGSAVYNIDPTNWVDEGLSTAKKYVYATPENSKLSDNYIQNGKKISEEKIALAGYRLAEILNNLL